MPFADMQMARLGNAAPEHGPHGQFDVAFELGFRDPRRLEVLPVEIGDAALAQHIERPAATAERRRYAQARDFGEDIGPKHRAVPGDRRTPVLADHHRPPFAQCSHQGYDVADIVKDAVGVDVGRRAGLAEAAHVGRDDAKTGGRQRRDLMPPGIG